MTVAPKIMVVDDSAVYRKIVSDVVRSIPDVELIATAPNGRIALDKLAQNPCDLVLLDVEMPEMDGLATLKAIGEQFEDTSVVMVSGTSRSSADIAMTAVDNGALDFVAKPVTTDPQQSRVELLRDLRPFVTAIRTNRYLRRALSLTQSAPTATPRRVETPAPRPHRAPTKDFSLAIIAISTGGPPALMRTIPLLSKRLATPLVVVQHMPPNFTASLADQLNKKSQLIVKEAEEGETPIAGTVYIAPGGRHLVIRRDGETLQLGMIDTPPVKGVRPSADVCLSSLASIRHGHTLTVTMTGMGSDGVDGVRELSNQGSYNIAQSEASCVVYGMPRAVVDSGLANEVLSLEQIASRINELLVGSSRR